VEKFAFAPPEKANSPFILPDGKHRGMEYYTAENAVYPVPLNRKKTAIQ
jgi:hypothetical protein